MYYIHFVEYNQPRLQAFTKKAEADKFWNSFKNSDYTWLEFMFKSPWVRVDPDSSVSDFERWNDERTK